MLAYVRDDELHVLNLSYGEPKQLTFGARGNAKVIELPIKHPELFESFGIAQPKESCFFLVPQAEECILRVVERANVLVIYLSTDAAESETDLLQALTMQNSKTIPLVKRPGHSSSKWDPLL
ncbi:O-fucosyltransferase 36-like [Magnolia sinica]|uniref:O-fucosyltransferase 36-like n=1 Tax=Magnolia sinica TaxID=86752 RepID=UPI002658F8BB|nr:O-fucosyltransferase 36-like [Magnolia sinica]